MESFYLSGYSQLYLEKQSMLIQRFVSIRDLLTTTKEGFCQFLSTLNISRNKSLKIYQFIQHKKNDYSIDRPSQIQSIDVDDIDEYRLEPIKEDKNKDSHELNEMLINFKNGLYDESKKEYEITLSNVQIKAFKPRDKEMVIRIKANDIKSFKNTNSTAT